MSGFEYHPEIQSALNSVFVIKLFKIFVILENPPWNEDNIPLPNHHADKLPCREIHYSYNKENNTGMVMIYGDVPSIYYWRTFVSQKSLYHPQENHDDRLKDHLQHYLRVMFPQHRHFTIINYGIMDWSSDPYHTGVHMWRPGVKSSSITQMLSSFGKNRNMHICGETFSNYQGFIEGCIRTADDVLKKIDFP
jgi:monoamine oxidase